MKQKVSDLIANFFEEKKITCAFGIVGAGNAHIFDSIVKKGFTELICTHHEQAAIMAAIGYYRIKKQIAAVILTTGAGSTNGVTGVVSAWMDSIPCLIIAGNEHSKYIENNPKRIWGVQGYDSIAMVDKVTKMSTRILDPDNVYFTMNAAYSTALFNRYGPVWLEIPMNIQSASTSICSAPLKNEINIQSQQDQNVFFYQNTLEKLKILIEKSKCPLLWLGHGIRLAGADDLVENFVNKLGIPVLVSWAGIDLLDSEHPLHYGCAGVYGQRSSNFILQNCDLLITVGTRLAIPQIGYEISEFIRNGKLVIVDIDEDEIKKFEEKVTLPILSDAKNFILSLLNMNEMKPKNDIRDWISYCSRMKSKYPRVDKDHNDKNGFINSYQFIDRLFSTFKKNQIIVTDMGTALLSGHQASKLRAGQRMLTSTGLGEMGFGLPAAIGASFARNKDEVICLNCDGGMMLNLQELQTIVHHKLPIKIIIFNNDGYLMIKHTQKALFKGHYSGTNSQSGVSCPNYKKIAAAFDIPYFSIKTWDDFNNHIPTMKEINSSVFCEVYMDPEQLFLPKLSLAMNEKGELISPPLEDLSPLLPREEFKQNMLIRLHQKSLDLNVTA